MTLCYQNAIEFPRVRRRVVEARFNAGELTSDGGSLLLRQADRHLGLTDAVARAPEDPRRRASCLHDVGSLLRQRVYAVALGYEDLNDHHTLRGDVALQTAVGRDRALASAATLCRFENRAGRGRRYGSSSEAIRGFAVGSSCAGATVTMWTTSWEWRRTIA